MRYDAVTEEGRFANPGSGAIEKLIRYHHVERSVLLLQRPHRGSRQYALHTQQLHSINVCPKGHLCGREAVSLAVSRKKCDSLLLQSPDNERIGRTAEGCIDFDFLDVLKFRHLVEATAADDTNLRCRHELCVKQSSFWFWNRPSHLSRRVEPLLNDPYLH